LQPCAYKDAKDIYKALRRLHAAGELDALQELALFSPERAPEELYDLAKDPWELENLAENPAHKGTLEELRADLDTWIKESGDKGQVPEPDSMYDSDMKVYVDGMRSRPEHLAIIEANIAQMKAWQAQGI
jgi:arylsulfatase A-like enzyme